MNQDYLFSNDSNQFEISSDILLNVNNGFLKNNISKIIIYINLFIVSFFCNIKNYFANHFSFLSLNLFIRSEKMKKKLYRNKIKKNSKQVSDVYGLVDAIKILSSISFGYWKFKKHLKKMKKSAILIFKKINQIIIFKSSIFSFWISKKFWNVKFILLSFFLKNTMALFRNVNFYLNFKKEC